MGTMTSSLKKLIGNISKNEQANFIHILMLIFILGSSQPSEVDAEELHSGVFENLVLAVTSAGDVIGRYDESQGEGVSKNCSFYLKGKTSGGKAKLKTWSDRVLPGTLKAVSDGVELKVDNGGQHAGCGLVLLPQISEGIRLDLIQHTKWLDVRIISGERVTLHSAPLQSSQTLGSLSGGTTVGVVAQKTPWVLVESVRLGDKKKGWIKIDQAKEPLPPRYK